MHASKCFTSLALFLQAGAAAAIIVITALKFSNFEAVTTTGGGTTVTESCALGQFESGWSMCTYAYVLSSISLAATLVLGLLLCITCNCCGIGAVLDAAFAMIGVAWWVIGAIFITNRSTSPAQLADWRTAIIGLSWGCVGLFGLALVLLLYRGCAACCGRGRGRKDARDVEAPVAAQTQLAYPPYPAYASKPGSQVPNGPQFIVRS